MAHLPGRVPKPAVPLLRSATEAAPKTFLPVAVTLPRTALSIVRLKPALTTIIANVRPNVYALAAAAVM